NSPHNPSGTALTLNELQLIADVAIEHDLIVITDEVYEHLTFDDVQHIPIATLPGMRERTVSISSAGKTFSVTGWKIGWICAPADVRPLGIDDGEAFARALPHEAGVVGIPTAVFCDHPDVGRPFVRFAFCKRDDVLDEAVARLTSYAERRR